jgi:hypothetical protein
VFDVSLNGAVITVTNIYDGDVTGAADVDSGVSITGTTQGTN